MEWNRLLFLFLFFSTNLCFSKDRERNLFINNDFNVFFSIDKSKKIFLLSNKFLHSVGSKNKNKILDIFHSIRSIKTKKEFILKKELSNFFFVRLFWWYTIY